MRWHLFATAFAAATLLAVFVGLQAGRTGAHAFHGTPYPEAEPAPDFALTDHHGNPVRLADFREETVLLFFGFTHCPDVCPLTLMRLGEVLEGLGRRAERARILLVTVDPERDTPEVLDAYVRRFGPRVTGLTGDPATLEAMRRAYGVYAQMHPGHGDGEPMVMHTDAVFGIDRSGQLRVLLHADGPEEELRADIRTLLAL
jgi:protein SCO1